MVLIDSNIFYPTQGESYLVVKKHEKDLAISLIRQELPCVLSQMHPKNDGGRGLLKAVLEMYGLNLCANIEHVRSYVQHTLLWFQAQGRSGCEVEKEGINEADAVLQVGNGVMSF
jgi:hypothetical protein